MVACGEPMQWPTWLCSTVSLVVVELLSAAEEGSFAGLGPAEVRAGFGLLPVVVQVRSNAYMARVAGERGPWLLAAPTSSDVPQTHLVIRLAGLHDLVALLLYNLGIEDVTRVDSLVRGHDRDLLLHVTANRSILARLIGRVEETCRSDRKRRNGSCVHRVSLNVTL